MNGMSDMVIFLLNHNSDINVKDKRIMNCSHSKTPLHIAVESGSSIITDILLNHSANVYSKDRRAKNSFLEEPRFTLQLSLIFLISFDFY